MTDSHAADVQAELQQYLNSKNINSLFIQIVESLLIEKPANPIAFIIEYLNKQYPDQAKEAMGGTGGVGAGSGGDNSVVASGTSAAPAAASGGPNDDDSDEDDEDDIVDMPDIVPQAKPKSRRVSVSAESMDPNKLKSQMSEVTSIEKSPEVAEKLLSIVAKSPLLRTLDAEQKDTIVKAFSGPITKAPGEDIIVQGEIGDIFYLLEEGEVDIYIQKGDAEKTKVHTYKPGDGFGELAIMYNAPRAATCTAATECKLWQLDRVSFKVIVVAAAMQKRETYIGFLKGVPILSSVTDMEIMTLADSLAEEVYENDSVICKQGDAGDFFYIIKEGEAKCYQVDAQGTDQEVAVLQTGMYFGEIALLTAKPRQATVKASGKLRVLAIDRATFTRVMGPLDEIMKRNMEEYNKYAAQGI